MDKLNSQMSVFIITILQSLQDDIQTLADNMMESYGIKLDN